jgi:hypothetical protein
MARINDEEKPSEEDAAYNEEDSESSEGCGKIKGVGCQAAAERLLERLQGLIELE